MHRVTAFSLAVAAIAAPAVPLARPYLGAAVGFARPTGDAYQGLAMADTVGGQIPVLLEAGWRFAPGLSVGGWFRLTPGWAGGDLDDLCDLAGTACSASGFAFGAAAAWSFLPAAKYQPWAGLSLGWERLDLDLGGGETARLSGFEFLGVQAGCDLSLVRHLVVGPWIAVGLGRYDQIALDTGAGSDTQEVPDKATHQWLSIGVRTRFTF